MNTKLGVNERGQFALLVYDLLQRVQKFGDHINTTELCSAISNGIMLWDDVVFQDKLRTRTHPERLRGAWLKHVRTVFNQLDPVLLQNMATHAEPDHPFRFLLATDMALYPRDLTQTPHVSPLSNNIANCSHRRHIVIDLDHGLDAKQRVLHQLSLYQRSPLASGIHLDLRHFTFTSGNVLLYLELPEALVMGSVQELTIQFGRGHQPAEWRELKQKDTRLARFCDLDPYLSLENGPLALLLLNAPFLRILRVMHACEQPNTELEVCPLVEQTLGHGAPALEEAWLGGMVSLEMFEIESFGHLRVLEALVPFSYNTLHKLAINCAHIEWLSIEVEDLTEEELPFTGVFLNLQTLVSPSHDVLRTLLSANGCPKLRTVLFGDNHYRTADVVTKLLTRPNLTLGFHKGVTTTCAVPIVWSLAQELASRDMRPRLLFLEVHPRVLSLIASEWVKCYVEHDHKWQDGPEYPPLASVEIRDCHLTIGAASKAVNFGSLSLCDGRTMSFVNCSDYTAGATDAVKANPSSEVDWRVWIEKYSRKFLDVTGIKLRIE